MANKAPFTILRTIETFYPSVTGPGFEALEVSKRLSLHGIRSVIFTVAKDAPAGIDILDGIEVRRLPVKGSFMRYYRTPALGRELKHAHGDIIHSYNYRNYQADVAFKVAKRMKIPFVISVHGALSGYRHFVGKSRQFPYKLYDSVTRRRTVLGADRVVVSSEQEVGEALEYGIPKERIRRIPMGIDVTEYKPKRTDHKQVILLFVGRLSRNRNLEPLIRAMALLGEDAKLRIVGSEAQSSTSSQKGYVEELKDLADSLDVKSVEFCGPRYGKDLNKEYEEADIFVNTSVYESFCQCLQQAAAAGLPVITTKVGIAQEFIKDGVNGFIIESDEKQIAERVRALMDFKKRVSWGNMLREEVRRLYDWDVVVGELEKMYLELKSQP
jgi:glycosyltransferase involved in cell wall biosynthesis